MNELEKVLDRTHPVKLIKAELITTDAELIVLEPKLYVLLVPVVAGRK